MERTRKKKIANRGVIVFAFNSSKYNYAEMAVYTARRIESFLGLPTTLVTEDKYLVGDFSKAFVLTRQGVSIEVGYNSDNFVKNFKTIRAEWRGVTFVKTNDRTAFVTGDFSTDIAAIAKA